MSQTSSLWQQQCKIMETFDFAKVHRCMQALGWRWRGEEPSIDDLKYTAESLINWVIREIESGWESDWCSCSTGGFKASMHRVNGDWILSLEFIVAQADGKYI